MPPGNRTRGMTAGLVKEVQQRDLIVECLLKRPAIAAVRRASQCITLLEKSGGCGCISSIGRWIEERGGGKDIAVTVEHQRPIPIGGDRNSIVGPSNHAMLRIGSPWSNAFTHHSGLDGCCAGHHEAAEKDEQQQWQK